MLVRYEQLDRTLDYVEREALGVGGALVNALPFRRGRVLDGNLVELDGFSGSRPVPFTDPREPVDLEAIAKLLTFEDEPDVGDLYTFCPSGETTSARLVATREEAEALVLEHELPGIRIETTIRGVPGLDRVELSRRPHG